MRPGQDYRLQATPRIGRSAGLAGVSCVRAARCMAVGQTAAQRTLAASWDGRRWRVLTTPSP